MNCNTYKGGNKVKKSVFIFIISAIIGLGLGYLVFDVIAPDKSKETEVAVNDEKDTPKTSEPAKEETDPVGATAVSEDNILQTKGCLGCHSVSKLNLQGGATGPDLSKAYSNVKGKHGKPLNEFLKEPTSAVMSGVIGGNPLSDEEINQVVDLLKQASE